MKPPPIRDQSESSQISQSQGFFSKLLELARPASRTSREPKVRGIPDRDAIGIRRVYAFADFDFGLGNKCVGVLLAGEGFDMALAGLAGQAWRSSPAAVFHVRFLTDIVSPYALRIAPVIGFEFFVTMP